MSEHKKDLPEPFQEVVVKGPVCDPCQKARTSGPGVFLIRESAQTFRVLTRDGHLGGVREDC
jgi:hypothetical protein